MDITNITNNITIITADEHERLCNDSATLWDMVGTILESATLKYDGTELCFDDRIIAPLIKTVDADAYKNKLKALKAAKEAE